MDHARGGARTPLYVAPSSGALPGNHGTRGSVLYTRPRDRRLLLNPLSGTINSCGGSGGEAEGGRGAASRKSGAGGAARPPAPAPAPRELESRRRASRMRPLGPSHPHGLPVRELDWKAGEPGLGLTSGAEGGPRAEGRVA